MTNATTAVARPRWTTLAATGHAMMALAPLIMFLAGLIFGLSLGDIAVFLLVPIVVEGGAALLVYRIPKLWTRIAGLVVAVLGFMLLWWTIFGISLINSFFDFVPALLFVPGALIAIVADTASIVASRRGNAGSMPTGGERRALTIVRVVVGSLVVLSGILSPLTKSGADESKASATIQMKDFKFKPATMSVAAGSTILLTNDDPFWHTFTTAGDSLAATNIKLTPGSKALYTAPSQPGTYPFYCEPHGSSDPDEADDDDMNMTVTVT